MPTLLIRRRRPIGEPARPEGTTGAGRLAQALLDLGVAIDDVRQAVIDPDGPLEQLAGAVPGDRFDVVVLGSHLVNNPDDDRRRAFLGLAVSHLADGGRLLIEHHPVDWAETAEPTPTTPGVDPGATLGMVDVVRTPPYVSAVSVYDEGGGIVRQPFTARVLSEAELDAALERVGLTRRARLGPTWLEAGR
ncbi:MAG TPA: hypothetical protein VHL56_06560 [Candidatus Limnocylindrales bacterium]|nr:hypothetical protein [Candidatus Limnocylindrales bacterium]